MWRPPFRFRTPARILVVGPSGCGTTAFTENLVLNNLDLFETPPSTIHYCYRAWQEGFQPIRQRGIVFHEGIPTPRELTQWFPHGGLLIMNDLMNEGSGEKNVLDLFTKYSHHQNVTVIYLCQDMFPTGRYTKSISRNAHYVVAFKNPRDQLGVHNLLLQSFSTTWKDARDVFLQTTSRPFGYLLIDLHSASSDEVRLLSHLLKDEGWTRCCQKAPRS